MSLDTATPGDRILIPGNHTHQGRMPFPVFFPLFFLVIFLASAPRLDAQTTGKTGSSTATSVPPSQSKTPSLAQARRELALLDSGKALTLRIIELVALMSPSDSLAILAEFSGRAPASSRQDLWMKAASLSLVLGRFQDAARYFESAAGDGSGELEQALLLRAARCRIAAGDTPRARELAAESFRRAESNAKPIPPSPVAAPVAAPTTTTTVKKPSVPASRTKASSTTTSTTTTTLPLASQGERKPAPAPRPDSLAGVERVRQAGIRADLVEAWSWIAEGENSRCVEILRTLLGSQGKGAAAGSAERREALFILWNASDLVGRKEIAETLGSEFPDSPEAGLIQGSVKNPPLPHWLLGILPSAPRKAVSIPTTSVTPPTEGSRPAIAAGSTGTGTSRSETISEKTQDRLQVGYFSREENAKIFSRELISKGFSAYVEVRPHWEGSPRWAVTVDIQAFPESVPGGSSAPVSKLQATQIRLKEFGYESYPVE